MGHKVDVKRQAKRAFGRLGRGLADYAVKPKQPC